MEAATKPRFYAQIQTIRDQKYAFQESLQQVVGYTVGIYRAEEVVASLSMYLPTYRPTPEKAAAVLSGMHEAAQLISRKLVQEWCTGNQVSCFF